MRVVCLWLLQQPIHLVGLNVGEEEEKEREREWDDTTLMKLCSFQGV